MLASSAFCGTVRAGMVLPDSHLLYSLLRDGLWLVNSFYSQQSRGEACPACVCSCISPTEPLFVLERAIRKQLEKPQVDNGPSGSFDLVLGVLIGLLLGLSVGGALGRLTRRERPVPKPLPADVPPVTAASGGVSPQRNDVGGRVRRGVMVAPGGSSVRSV